jgi:hypothetical protein
MTSSGMLSHARLIEDVAAPTTCEEGTRGDWDGVHGSPPQAR